MLSKEFQYLIWDLNVIIGNMLKTELESDIIQKKFYIIKFNTFISSSSSLNIHQMFTGQKWFRLNCTHAENEVYWVKIMMTLSHQDNFTSLPQYNYFKFWIKYFDFKLCGRRWNKNFMWERIVSELTKRWAFFVSSPFVEILFIFHNFAPAQPWTKSGPVGKMRTNLWQGANIFIILSCPGPCENLHLSCHTATYGSYLLYESYYEHYVLIRFDVLGENKHKVRQLDFHVFYFL